ncbi:MAG: aldo/keto reductase [Bacteroidetes bacterium]|nr:aldo/keto reductase [Bacteroidota bacterium]
MNLGKLVDEQNSFALLDAALDAGINFIDTADVYGGIGARGRTEEIIGRWMAHGGGRREKIVLATKLYGKMGEVQNARGLSAFHIRQACEGSLRRLQTDHIDLYQMHHVDRATPWAEIWQAMDQLIQSGKVIYTGSSNFAAWNIVQAQYKAHERNLAGIVSEQSLYNLANRMIELEVIPACRALGIGLLPWSPLAEGLLAGILGGGIGVRKQTEIVQKQLARVRKQVQDYEAFCSSSGREPESVALAWLLKNPIVSSVIIGPRSIDQLNGMIEGMKVSLHENDMTTLNSIWPGPGGEAPEAYAW